MGFAWKGSMDQFQAASNSSLNQNMTVTCFGLGLEALYYFSQSAGAISCAGKDILRLRFSQIDNKHKICSMYTTGR